MQTPIRTDYVTIERVKAQISNETSFSDLENDLIGRQIAAAGSAVAMFTHRDFTSQNYDELYSGNGHQELHLRQFPIVAVDRCATEPTDILGVKNTSTTNSRATVSVDRTNLILKRTASGVLTPNSLAFATYTTLTTMADAITAVANGWVGRVTDTNYNNYSSADLREIQGALSAWNSQEVFLQIHLEELAEYDVEDKTGTLYYRYGWPRGRNNIRVVYTAGYEEVPEDIQHAVATLVAMWYNESKRDPGLIAEQGDGFYYLTLTQQSGSQLPGSIRRLLIPYIKHIV